MTMRRVKLLYTALMLLASHGALAVSYPLPPEGSRPGQRILPLSRSGTITPSCCWKVLPPSTARG